MRILGLGQPVLGQVLFKLLFFFFTLTEMELGECQLTEAGQGSFSYPPSSAMLRLALILPALLQPLSKGGVLHLPEWFKAPEHAQCTWLGEGAVYSCPLAVRSL